MSDASVFDRAVDEAWREFRTALADRLAALPADDVLVVGSLAPDRGSLLVTLDYCRAGDHLVCVARHAGIGEDHSLYDLACAAGWDDDPDRLDQVVLDVPVREVDRAAAASVVVLRDIAGLAHPSFVHARGSAGEERFTRAMAEPPADSEPWEPPAVEYPTSPDELHAAVERVLAARLDGTPETDDDGDFLVTIHDFPAYVMPHHKHPQVRILVPLLYDITGRTRAAEVLTELNSQYAFIRLTLASDRVSAVIDLPASPFSGKQLCDHLDRIEGFLHSLDDRFAERLGGKFYTESTSEPDDNADTDTDESEQLPSDLLTLLQLDVHGRGTLGAAQVAEICGYDRIAILDHIRTCEEQVIAWHSSADDASAADDHDEYDACIHEADAWQQTVDSLRAALRVVTVHTRSTSAGRDRDPAPPRQGALFDRPDQPGLFD